MRNLRTRDTAEKTLRKFLKLKPVVMRQKLPFSHFAHFAQYEKRPFAQRIRKNFT